MTEGLLSVCSFNVLHSHHAIKDHSKITFRGVEIFQFAQLEALRSKVDGQRYDLSSQTENFVFFSFSEVEGFA